MGQRSGAKRGVAQVIYLTTLTLLTIFMSGLVRAQSLTIVSGNFQDQPGAAAMTVQGNALPPGATVQWAVVQGQIPVPQALTTTNFDVAQRSSLSNWQSFNSGNGPNGRLISACIAPLASSPNDSRYCVFFNVVGCSVYTNIVQGDNESRRPNEPLPTTMIVEVTDNLGARKVGATVEWRVTPGGPTDGTLGGITITDTAQQVGIEGTGPNGRSAATYVAGSRIGTQSVTARPTTGCAPNTATFNVLVAGTPVNNPPIVTITRPSTDTERVVGDRQLITVRASDADAGDRVATLTLFARELESGTSTTLRTFSTPTRSSDIYEYEWQNLPEGIYAITARAVDTQGRPQTSAPVRLTVKREASKITLETAETARSLTPGTLISFSLLATDRGVGVPAQVIEWDITMIAKRAPGAAKTAPQSKAGCLAADAPTNGSVPTDVNGRATLSFTPGCAIEDRLLRFRLKDRPSVNDQATLRGPASQVTAIKVPTQLVARSIVATPGQPTLVSVTAVDGAGAPVAAIPISWRLISTTPVGDVQAVAATTNASGVAEARVTLLPNATQVLLEACVTGQLLACPTFVLKNSQAFVALPAASTTSTANTHALGSTRLQMNQITTRFQQLRNESGGGFSNGVGASVDGTRIPTGGSGSGSSSSSSTSSASTGGSNERDINADGMKRSRWGVFTLGDIDVSRVDDGTGGRTKLSTKGLTVGVDYRATPALTLGAAIGGLRGTASLAGDASQKASGVSGAFFGQWFSPGQFYANAIVNQGRNSYDLNRFGFDAKRIESSTKSTQTGFQLEGGYNFARDRFNISPYLRYEQVRVALGAINESNHEDALSISSSKLRANTFAFGLVADARFSTANGVWIPGLRAEYLSEKQKQGDAFAQLINGTPVVVPVPIAPYDNRYGNIGLSLQWLTGVAGQPISVFIGYDTTFGKEGVSTRRFTAGVKVPL